MELIVFSYYFMSMHYIQTTGSHQTHSEIYLHRRYYLDWCCIMAHSWRWRKKKLILRKFLVESVNFMCITCFDLYIPQHTHSNRHIKINKKLARKFRYMKHRLQINICKSFHFILLSVRINSIFHFIACTFAHLHKLQST